MKLRPHHLMCTQGYSGKGYSQEFVDNMDYLTNILRNDDNTLIELVFSTDDICSSCPHMLGLDLCNSNNKVKAIDDKMIHYFNLKEKKYSYNELIGLIRKTITEDIMDDICGLCQWYPVSSCKKNICCKYIGELEITEKVKESH